VSKIYVWNVCVGITSTLSCRASRDNCSEYSLLGCYSLLKERIMGTWLVDVKKILCATWESFGCSCLYRYESSNCDSARA